MSGLKEAIKVATDFAAAKLGVGAPVLQGGASSGDTPQCPFMSGRLGTPGMNMTQIAALYASMGLNVTDANIDVTQLHLESGQTLAGCPAAMAYLSQEKVPEDK